MENTDNTDNVHIIHEMEEKSPMSDWTDETLLEIEKTIESKLDQSSSVLENASNACQTNETTKTHTLNPSLQIMDTETMEMKVNESSSVLENAFNAPKTSETTETHTLNLNLEIIDTGSNIAKSDIEFSDEDDIPLAEIRRKALLEMSDAEIIENDNSDNDKDYHPTCEDIDSTDSDASIQAKQLRKQTLKSSRDKSWKKRGKIIRHRLSKAKRNLFQAELISKLSAAKSKAKMKRHIPKRKPHVQSPSTGLESSLLNQAKSRSIKENKIRTIVHKYHLQRLDNLLQSNGLKRVPIKGDGDCFFNAIGCQIQNKSSQELRDEICNHLVENADIYVQFIHCQEGEDQLLQYHKQIEILRMQGQWKENLADCLPLAIANHYKRPIKVFSSKITNPVFDIKPTVDAGDSPYIYIAHIGITKQEHYDGVIQRKRSNATDEVADLVSDKHYSETPQKSQDPLPNLTPHKDAYYQSPIRKQLKRKRKREPELWKRNVRKRNRTAGIEYQTAKGKEFPRRLLKEVGCSCKLKCMTKVTLQERQSFFDTFWGLQDYQRQRDLICQCVLSLKPKRSIGKKGISYEYNIAVGETKVRVCRTFFLNTLSIGKKTVHLALQNKAGGIFIGEDKRGKCSSVNKTSEESIQIIQKHIESFPRMESHYTRKTSNREYLAGDLTIRKMWELYVISCEKNGRKSVKEKTYRDIFCKEYNLSFFKPKKDQCSICMLYESKKKQGTIDEATECAFTEHQERKVRSREEKEKDKQRAKSDSKFHAATFDLQAVLSAPCSLVGELYYKRKLSCYNLSFYSLGDKAVSCYLWDETQAGRGSCEITTCLSQYTKSVTSGSSNVDEITYYSDTCGGQNRNKYVVAGFLKLINEDSGVNIINHKFFEKGHSQMESDSVHSSIEAAKKRTHVYVPTHWHTVVSLARKNKPFVVVPVRYSDIYDFKSFSHEFCPNMRYSTTGEKINWLKLKWIQVRRSSPTSVFVNVSFDPSKFVEVKVQQTTRSKRRSHQCPELKNLYQGKTPVSTAKKADLVSLCNSGIIPDEYHTYYKALLVGKGVKDRIPLPDAGESDCESEEDSEL